MHSPYRFMSIKTPLCLALFASTLLGCAPGSYLTPPASDDPWTLIRHARTWLEQGRPRGALPTLQKALNEAERLEPGADDTLHTQAAIYNELGRAYEMASELPFAEQQFLKASALADKLPMRRPLRFEVHYNLSTVLERQGRTDESCQHLAHAYALHRALLAEKAEPPFGYGEAGAHFLLDVAEPRMRARAARLSCEIGQ